MPAFAAPAHHSFEPAFSRSSASLRALSSSNLSNLNAASDHPQQLPPSKEFTLHRLYRSPRPKLQICQRNSQAPRRLTSWTQADFQRPIDHDMSPPESPPDLSSSRSSTRSPSLPSTSLATGDDLADTSHFEDISLTDDPTPVASDASRRPPKTRPLLRSSQTAPSPPLKQRPSTSALRDTTNTSGLRTKTTLKNHERSVNNSKSPPPRFSRANSSPRRLGVPGVESRSGSSSPGFRSSPSRSPRSSASTPRLNVEHQPIIPSARRGSAPGPRKTAKELEAEYDDLDDELPDDAIITNIPLSPRPPHQRSQSGSPERPRPISQPSLPMDVSSRTKSWDTALFDLSFEIQELTAKLEDHHDEMQQNPSTRSSSPVRRPAATNQRTKSTPLPPLQRGNPLIDPLPASKEKEKHLTRTRPSWLPPKDPKEEKKHLREYRKMMSKFNEAEKRKSAEAVEKNTLAAKQQYSALEIWQRQLLGDWDAAIANPRTRELWWRGIPPAIRGAVYQRAVSNDLHLSPASFRAALARAKAQESHLSSHPPPPTSSSSSSSAAESRQHDRARRSLATLDADISTVFPSSHLFQPSQRLHTPLRELLLAYASYRSDTGHVRGTAALAASVLAHLPQPEDAFPVFANLLNKPHCLAFCINDPAGKQRAYRAISRALRYKLPRLAGHLQSTFPEDDQSYLEILCKSLCTSHVLDLEACSRILDLVVFEGDAPAAVRSVVGVLGMIEGKLYGSREDIQKVLGWDSDVVVSAPADEVLGWIKWAGKAEERAPLSSS